MLPIFREIGGEATVRWLLIKPLQDHPRRRARRGDSFPAPLEPPKRRNSAIDCTVETQVGNPRLRKRERVEVRVKRVVNAAKLGTDAGRAAPAGWRAAGLKDAASPDRTAMA